MKILHICSIEDDMASGVSVIVPQYAKNQGSMHDVILYNVNDHQCSAIDGVTVFNREKKLEDILSEGDVEIAVFHGIYFFPYISIYKKLLQKGIPYVVIPHGSLRHEAQSQKKLAKIIMNALFFRSFVERAAIIQYLSEIEREASSRFENNNFVMPNGVPEVDVRWKRQQREGLQLIFIGRYSIFYKGLDILFDACDSIKEFMREKDIALHLYGVDFENNLSKMREILRQKKIGDIVKIHGPVFGEEKKRVILNADCFIQASRSEGQPVGILEAMSYGLVPIVTEGTSFSKLVAEHACGFDAGNDADSVAGAIMEAYAMRNKLSVLSENAIKLIREKYLWKNVVQRTIEAYQNMIDNKTNVFSGLEEEK